MQTTQIYTKQTTGIMNIRLRDVKPLAVIRSVGNITFRTMLIVAFIVTLITVVTSNNTTDIGIRSFTVLSGSMEPTISTGSVIYTLNNLGYNVGDIITYKTATDQTVTHRIVEIQNNGEVLYLTKGDANATPDANFVTADRIIGKTYFSLPLIGKISQQLKTPQGLFIVVLMPALLIIGWELWNIKGEIERSVEKRMLERLKKEGAAGAVWPEHRS